MSESGIPPEFRPGAAIYDGKVLLWSTSVIIDPDVPVEIQLFPDYRLRVIFEVADATKYAYQGEAGADLIKLTFGVKPVMAKNTKWGAMFAACTPIVQITTEPNHYLSVAAQIIGGTYADITCCMWGDADGAK